LGQGDSAEEPITEREVVITRVVDAPARLLFEAFSKPEHLTRWYGPKGWPLTLCEIDFRVGGRYRFAMTGPDGKQSTPFGGEYLEIVPNKKIVYNDTWESPDSEQILVTVTFDEEDGKTTLTIHILFASVAMKNQHLGTGFLQSFNSSLDQLMDLITELRG
jgi:uncharacterized protein YndB with AHSA1/START domain